MAVEMTMQRKAEIPPQSPLIKGGKAAEIPPQSALVMGGRAFLVFYLQEATPRLKRLVSFPLDLDCVLGTRTIGGLLLYSGDDGGVQKNFAARIAAKVGYGEQKGFLISHFASNDIAIHEAFEETAKDSRALIPISSHIDWMGMFHWDIRAQSRLDLSLSVLRSPIACAVSKSVRLFSVSRGLVMSAELGISGRRSFGAFWLTQRHTRLWPKLKGIPLGALVFTNANLTLSKTEPAQLGQVQDLSQESQETSRASCP